MDGITKYVGIDISKEKIAVAVVDTNRERSRYLVLTVKTHRALRCTMP
ncbi:hypothetical protein JNUCC74_01530 [Cerasibacillus sp. JNUCC 74]